MKQRNPGLQYLISVSLILFSAIINYGISLVLTPYITGCLGTEAYGYVSLAKTFANYATVITVAVNSVATRFITVEYHKRNYEKANIYYSTLFFADIILSGVILCIASVFIKNLDRFLNIRTDLIYDVKILFILSVINICIISLGTVFNSAALIRNRLDVASIYKIIAYIVEAVALLLLFSNKTPHVQYVGMALVVSAMTLVILNYVYQKTKVQELVIKIKSFKKFAIREAFTSGIWYSFNSLGNMLNSGLDLWMSNLLLSALQMGQLAIVKTVTTIGTALYQLTAQPFQPILIRNYADGDKDKLTYCLKLALKANGCLSNILFAFLTVFGLNYYKLWTPNENVELLTSITFISMIGTVIEGTVTPLYYIYVLTLKNKVPSVITFIAGMLNVVSMYILIKYFHFGLEVVVGTTTVLSWLTNFVFTPTYACSCLRIKKDTFYGTLIRNIISAGLLVLLFKAIRSIVNPIDWAVMIFAAALCTVIGVAIHFAVVLDKNEIRTLQHYFKTIVSKVVK